MANGRQGKPARIADPANGHRRRQGAADACAGDGNRKAQGRTHGWKATERPWRLRASGIGRGASGTESRGSAARNSSEEKLPENNADSRAGQRCERSRHAGACKWKKARETLVSRAFSRHFGGRYWDGTSDPCRVKGKSYLVFAVFIAVFAIIWDTMGTVR